MDNISIANLEAELAYLDDDLPKNRQSPCWPSRLLTEALSIAD